jgi:mRNA interferase MazF
MNVPVLYCRRANQPASGGQFFAYSGAQSSRPAKKSWVKISQIRTLSVEWIGRRMVRVPPEIADQIIEGLNEIIG